ncbi:MAG: hypothetical protein AB7E32_03855 [Desulfovibrio sp.]
MNRLFTLATFLFDPLHYHWEKETTQKTVAGLLVALFLLALGVIELNRNGWAPSWLGWFPYTSHFEAVNLAFGFVLVLEVISLIFTLPCSISKAVGKQFEILALILMRGTFKQLAYFPEPIHVVGNEDLVLRIAADGGGALLIFALLGAYRLLQRPDEEFKKGEAIFHFVSAKKVVALGLLGIFIGLSIQHGVLHLMGKPTPEFFPAFYTVLVFSDILLVLIAQHFLPHFRAVFRNSGFALATLFIRLALTAPVYYNAVLGVGAAVYALLLTLVYNTFYAPKRNRP